MSNTRDLKALKLTVTMDTKEVKGGFNNLVASTNNFFNSLKSRLGSIHSLQKNIAFEEQAIKKEESKIDSKVAKAEAERNRILEKLNNVPKYQQFNTLDKITTKIQEQNKALQGTIEAQSKIKEAFLKSPVDFYKNLFGKNILHKGVEIPFQQFMQTFTNTGLTKKVKKAYSDYLATNPTQFFPRVPINKIKPNADNDFLQYVQRKGEVLTGSKNEKLYGTKEEQTAQNKRVASFLATQGIITPEKHLAEFKGYQTTLDNATKDIKELESLRDKIVQFNEAEKKLTQTTENANKAKGGLAERVANLTGLKNKLPTEVEGLKKDVLDIIGSGRLNEETKQLIQKDHSIPRLVSRLQEMHKDVIGPAQSYLYLKGLETPLVRRNLNDFEEELNRKIKNGIIPEADKQGYIDFFNKVVAGAVDPRDQIKDVIQRSKATDKIIGELKKVKELPDISGIKPTTDQNILATYQEHEKNTSNVYNSVAKTLKRLGAELPEKYDKTAVQNAVSALVERYPLNELEKERIQNSTKDLEGLYNRRTALSEVIKQSQENIKIQQEDKRLGEERARIIRETQNAINANNARTQLASNDLEKLKEQKTQAETRVGNLQRAASVFKMDSTGAEKFDPNKSFNEQWQKVVARDDKLFNNPAVENAAKELHTTLRNQQDDLKSVNQAITDYPTKLRNARLDELTRQTNSLNSAFQQINNNSLINTLKEGKTISPESFEGLQITGLSNSVKALLKEHVNSLAINGVKVNDKATEKTLQNAVSLARQTNPTGFNQNEVNRLTPQYNTLRDIDKQLDGYIAVQKRGKTDTPLTEAAEKANYERDLQHDINSRNMQLYALSHALKAIEAPIQQGVDIGKGNIDEYVKFQSAMVGVAKLLPVLRDKDTLLVNDKFKEFRQGILDMTEYLPRSGVELAHAAESASRLGVTNPDQIRKVVEAGTMLGNAFGMAPNDVTTQIVKIANAKGINLNKEGSIDEVMDFADAINYLDDHTAATGRDILNFTKRAVQTAEGVKMSTKDVAAFGATMVSLGVTADQANTAFKNFMTVLQTGPRNRKKGYEYFEKSGLKPADVARAFKENPTKVAVEFIKRLHALRNAPAGSDAAAIVRFAFGQQASQPLMALVNNPEILEKYIKEARYDSSGWTLKEHTAKQLNDPAVRFKLMQQKIQKLQIDTGEILMPVAEKFIKSIKGIANALTPFVKNNSDLIQNTAYTSVGLLAAVKGAGFLVDTATIFNNLRNWQGIQHFGEKWADLKSKSEFFRAISGIGGWFTGIWDMITKTPIGKVPLIGKLFQKWLGEAALTGEGAWTTGSMLLGIPAAAFGGWTAGRFLSTQRWFGGKSIDDLFFESGNLYNANKSEIKARGTFADTQRRSSAENSSVFQSKKLADLQHKLNAQGFEVAKDKNGKLIINRLIKDKNGNITRRQIDIGSSKFKASWQEAFAGPYNPIIGTGVALKHLYHEFQNYRDIDGISEKDNPELFGLIDQAIQTYSKQKGARAREGILAQGEGTWYNKFRNKQIKVADERVQLEQNLSAHLALAYKYGQEGNKLLQHYEEMKANEIKGTLKWKKDWQVKARQIAEEYGNQNLSEEQWEQLYKNVLDTKSKKKNEKPQKDNSIQGILNNIDNNPFINGTQIGKALSITSNLDKAAELYKNIIAMRDLRKTNQDLYTQEGGDKQYQKYTDWFVGLQATIAKQQGIGNDPNAMNVVLQEITDKWLSNQKAIESSKGEVVKYQEAMKKAEEENKKSIDNTKQQLTDLTQNPWEVQITANTKGVDQAIARVTTQLNSLGGVNKGGGTPQNYNNYQEPKLA